MGKKIINFFVFANIWVALNTVFFTATTMIVFSLEMNYPLLLFSFFSVLLAYNFQRLVKFSNLSLYSERIQWLATRKKLIFFLVVIGLIGAIISILMLPIWVWYLLIIPAILSFFYVLPDFQGFRRKLNRFSLRNIPFIKIYLIAFSWMVISVFIPLFTASLLEEINLLIVVLILAEKFIFIIAITIPFDIRDIKIDEKEKKTIPQLLGISRSKWLAVFLLLISSTLILIIYKFGIYNLQILFSLLISNIIAGIVISKINETKKELFYSGVIEGLFFIQFVLVLIGRVMS